MRYFITSSKDATIYTDYSVQNTGIDQILEVRKWNTTDGSRNGYSRALIEFDYDSISLGVSPTMSLQLSATKFREIPRTFTLEVRPLSQSWDMGLGKRQDDPVITDGVSWEWVDSVNGTAWGTAGGTFLTPTASYSFSQKTGDLNADITSIVTDVINNVIPNNGMAVKFTTTIETSSLHYGSVNFFSSETNTIYKPKVVVDWYDAIGLDTSGSEVKSDNVFCNIKNLRTSYESERTYKFEVYARDLYPSLTFESGSNFTKRFTDVKYLPTGSEYSVVDNITGDVIVPFGNNSKFSRDDTYSYFKLNFKGWEPERYYRIKIKVDDGEEINIIDNNFTFKLVDNE